MVLVVHIIDKTREIKLSDATEETELKEAVTEEKDVSVHENEIYVASISVEEKRRRLCLTQESIKGNWMISKLV